jgi:hypothetical protein
MAWRMKLASAAVAAWVLGAGSLSAALIVDPAQTITRQVTVQLIQTAKGTAQATVFGNASQRADIEAGIDAIWAQAGIDINILPTITPYNNAFAYEGNDGSGTRSSNDLNTIFSNAASAGGILSAAPLTLNLVLVNVVPAFTPLSENTSAGYARVSGNGITAFVGDNLLTFDGGRDVISSVFAHEIGHNLGLNHTSNNLPNLMSPGGSTQQLSPSQITTARSSNFARLYTPPATLVGDFNNNGVVDAADYVVWRKTLNTPVDYTAWRSHFGQTGGTGSLVGDNAALDVTGGVPEPSAIAYFLIVLTCLPANRTRTRTNR